MRQVLNKSMFVMAAASGILTAVGGYAHADASAEGAAVNSPGVGSGNVAQVPVHIPVNACGNTVNAAALLNPSFGNECANIGSAKGHHDEGSEQSDHQGEDRGIHSEDAYGSATEETSGESDRGHAGPSSDAYGDDVYQGYGGANAEAVAAGSPGMLSGNVVQAPVHIPVNVCGNSVNLIALLNVAADNECVNESGPVEPPADEPKVDEPPAATEEPPADEPSVSAPAPNAPIAQLAHTGAGEIGLAAGGAAALLLGGAVLMRRTRAARN